MNCPAVQPHKDLREVPKDTAYNAGQMERHSGMR